MSRSDARDNGGGRGGSSEASWPARGEAEEGEAIQIERWGAPVAVLLSAARYQKLARHQRPVRTRPRESGCSLVAWGAARSAGEGQSLTPPSGDGQIAAGAAVHDASLVTYDLRDFEHCSGLRVERLHLTAPLSGKRR